VAVRVPDDLTQSPTIGLAPHPGPGAAPPAPAFGPPPDTAGRRRRSSPPSSVRNVVEWVVIVVAALLVALVIKTFLIQAFYIPSASMENTLNISDRVLVNKLSYRVHDINRGDIVVFKRPPNEGGDAAVKDLIKRVIALPGETIEARSDGKVYIDDHELREPYLAPDATTTNLPRQVVPKDHYWVMGDNRGNSKDARVFGPIPRSLIVGRAFVKVWPPSAIDLL
jgi:signal peptidase I